MTVPSESIESEVLRLRSTGRAFARISRELGMAKPADAQRAFQRAVRQLPPADGDRVRNAEMSRLDRLADKVRTDANKTPDERARQLAAVDRLRAWMTEDG